MAEMKEKEQATLKLHARYKSKQIELLASARTFIQLIRFDRKIKYIYTKLVPCYVYININVYIE